MSGVRTLIADDEKPARERLRLALSSMPEIEIIAEAVNGLEALELIEELDPQLVFLDVQMPAMNGFEVLRRCGKRPAVIFTTAYDEYALQAFDVHAVDYLLKPYGKERLKDAVRHALEHLDAPAPGIAALIADQRKGEGYLTRIGIRNGRSYRIAAVEQADYFKAEDGLVFWVEKKDRRLISETLNELESRLDPARFMRVHRSVIANLSKITRVIPLGRGRLSAEFPSGERVEVGRTRLDAFRRAMRLQ